MPETFDLAAEERLDLVVPATPDEVAAVVAAMVSSNPLKGAPFRGVIRPDGFEVRRVVRGRGGMHPTFRGRFEVVPGGTRVTATSALPPWSRMFGRGLAIYAALFGLVWLGMGALVAGVPESPLALAGALFMGLVWLPIVGVILSGSLVSRGVAARAEAPVLLRDALLARWPASAPEASVSVAAPRPTPQAQSIA
jgi:hypothetical protein